jgi:hypothetical protein
MKNSRDLQVWRKAHALTVDCYKVTGTFPKCELYGITVVGQFAGEPSLTTKDTKVHEGMPLPSRTFVRLRVLRG